MIEMATPQRAIMGHDYLLNGSRLAICLGFLGHRIGNDLVVHILLLMLLMLLMLLSIYQRHG
jgi:hypothetical protein